jgi:HprK-related kinase A
MAGKGVFLYIGPFVIHLRCAVPLVAEGVHVLYGDYRCEAHAPFADFHVYLGPPKGLRRWLRSQVLFYFDDWPPFKPLPHSQAFAMFEWGMNWCITSHSQQHLMLHSAVVEKDGLGLILPAPPASGKSTLCAALVNRGWRLLSDEMTVISMDDLELQPMPRPVSLKNRSIDVIRDFAPDATIGAPALDTDKGTVAHMRPPSDSVARGRESVRPAWIALPKYHGGAPARLTELPKGEAMMRIVENAFNYSVLGLRGFRAAATLIDRCDCYTFTYGDLGEAVKVFEELVSRGR